MPWKIFAAATMLLELVLMAGTMCYLLLVKEANIKMGGTIILGSLLLRHLASRIYSDRESHITGIKLPPRAEWPWRLIIWCLIALILIWWAPFPFK